MSLSTNGWKNFPKKFEVELWPGSLLAQHGPTLHFPYTSQIEGRLREMRMRLGKTRYRVLYFFNDDRIGVLLHGFTKDTAAVPVYDKNVAGVRMKDHINRMKQKGPSPRK